MSITINQLRFSYQSNGCDQLDIAQWNLNTSEQVFLHGPSGCGKTTLLKLICGLLTPNQGTISVLDQEINSLNAAKRDAFRAKNIGYIAQSFNLIPYLSPIENIQLAQTFAKQSTDICPKQTLKQLNIGPSCWRQPCETLSIGQQQRVAIARALINQPKLIIADEPTSSLDSQNTEVFMQLLQQVCNENHAALLFVSHDKQLAAHFARVQSLPSINRVN